MLNIKTLYNENKKEIAYFGQNVDGTFSLRGANGTILNNYKKDKITYEELEQIKMMYGLLLEEELGQITLDELL